MREYRGRASRQSIERERVSRERISRQSRIERGRASERARGRYGSTHTAPNKAFFLEKKQKKKKKKKKKKKLKKKKKKKEKKKKTKKLKVKRTTIASASLPRLLTANLLHTMASEPLLPKRIEFDVREKTTLHTLVFSLHFKVYCEIL